jgi:hypothetical protein
MTKTRVRAALVALFAIALAVGLTVGADPALASSGSVPDDMSPTCSAGQPKLDYEVQEQTNIGVGGYTYSYLWENVCGIGDWTWDAYSSGIGSQLLYAIRMPTSPGHRVWLHEPGGSATLCMYSTGNDVYLGNYIGTVGDWVESPADVQVSTNTAPCP